MTEVWRQFERAATQYQAHTPIQAQVSQDLCAWLQASSVLQADQVWVDAGCGTGRLAGWLAAQGMRVWAIDQAPAMLQQLPDSPLIQPLCADIRALPLPDASVDGLVSSFVLHWLPPSCLNELLRVVQSAGQLWLAIPVAGSLSQIVQRYPDFPVYDFAPMQAWCDAAGAALVRHYSQRYCAKYPNLLTLLRHLKAMGGAGQQALASAGNARQMRRWLADQRPIELDFEVLFLNLRQDAWQSFAPWQRESR